LRRAVWRQRWDRTGPRGCSGATGGGPRGADRWTIARPTPTVTDPDTDPDQADRWMHTHAHLSHRNVTTKEMGGNVCGAQRAGRDATDRRFQSTFAIGLSASLCAGRYEREEGCSYPQRCSSISALAQLSLSHPPPSASASTPTAWSFVERAAGRRRKYSSRRQSNKRSSSRRRLLLLLPLPLLIQSALVVAAVSAVAAAAATPKPIRLAP